MHPKQTFWARVADLVTGSPERVSALGHERLRVTERGLRLPLDGRSYEIAMGERRLQLAPDLAVAGGDEGYDHSLLAFDPEQFYGRIGHFARLAPGDTLSINPHSGGPERLFTSPHDALRSSVRIRHEGDQLVLKATPEPESFVTTVDETTAGNRIRTERRHALRRIGAIYGDMLECLAPDAALALLSRVNRLLEREPYRDRAGDGAPGGIVELPADKTPIVIGDLHGQVDNLLNVLCQNAFLDSLEQEQAALVILGDAVHPENPDALENMESSMLIMDLILRLKFAFPSGVFFLLGNHDSFSTELMKDGVPQGIVWDRYLVGQRGEEYRDEMRRFYALSPLLLQSERFVACHAGPPRIAFDRQMLVDVRHHPTLLHELTWNRQKTRGHAGGYTGGDVQRLFKVLGMPADSTLVVGHYPRSQKGSVWLDAGGVRGHHVLISSMPNETAVLARVDGEFVPQIFPSQRLLPWLNREMIDGAGVGDLSRSARSAAPQASRAVQ